MWNQGKMQTPAITIWFPEQCLLGFFILEKQLASQYMFLIRSKLSITLCISFLYYIYLHPYSHYHFSKILRPFCVSRNWWIIIAFLQRNSLTIRIVSQKYRELLQPYDRFSKISRTFYASRNLRTIVVFLQPTPKEKLPIFLINTLLLHIPLLALTDRQNDGQRDKLILVGHGNLPFLQVNCSIPSKQQPYNHDIFSKISRASTALQSRSFLKNMENFLCK